MRYWGHIVLTLSVATTAGCQAGSAAASRHDTLASVPPRLSTQDLRQPTDAQWDATNSDESFSGIAARQGDSTALERQQGLASYYADSLAGHPMSNGQPYDPRLPTMAHRTLPFGTIVRVVRVATGTSVTVRVTDRGPYGNKRRIADLSREAARRLDMLRDGVVEVRLEVLGPGEDGPHRARRPFPRNGSRGSLQTRAK
jgi:rare lipoprotein A